MRPFSKIVQLGIAFNETVCQPTVTMVGMLAHVDKARNRLFLSGLPVTKDFCTIALTTTLNLVYPLLSESGRKLPKLTTIDRRLVSSVFLFGNGEAYNGTTVCQSLVVFFRTKRVCRLSNRNVAICFSVFALPIP